MVFVICNLSHNSCHRLLTYSFPLSERASENPSLGQYSSIITLATVAASLFLRGNALACLVNPSSIFNGCRSRFLVSGSAPLDQCEPFDRDTQIFMVDVLRL